MGFSGGGGGSSGVSAHKHNGQSGEGGPLKFNNSITTGSSVTFATTGGTEYPIEVIL